jgi:hypothetical protein
MKQLLGIFLERAHREELLPPRSGRYEREVGMVVSM